MIASRMAYPPDGGLNDPHPRVSSPPLASSPPTRIRTSGIFTRRLSLTAASVANASSSLFGSSPPTSNTSGSIYQQSSFFRSSSTGVHSNSAAAAAASSSSINISSSANNVPSTSTQSSSSGSGQVIGGSTSGRQRTRSTSHPPPPKYKSYRTPQLRISLQDVIGNLVLSAPVMAPGESIRGQIHLELPKATPVHSIEVYLTGTVTALDGTRLGSMKTVTILEECKTVATASITNTRTNTTRRHTTPSPSATASVATGGAAATASQDSTTTTTTATATTTAVSGGRGRRRSIVNGAIADRSRSPTYPPPSGMAAIAATAAAATIAAQSQGNSRRLSTELMSRTLSMPSSSYPYAQHNNGSTLSLNRSASPTPADLRGRRTSFSANVDVPGGFSSLLGLGLGLGGGRGGMSMVNISTISQQFPLDDPSEPEAPSYDPPHYEGIFTDNARSSTESGGGEAGANATSPGEIVSAPIATTSSRQTEEPASTPVSAPLATTTTTDEDAASPDSEPISAPIPTPSPSDSTDDVRTQSSRSSRDGRSDPTPTASSNTTTTTIAATTPPAEPVEPKAVLMQPGNYVIPFSIRIPSNSTMSLPGSFTDPVGNISYQLKAVMKQILPSPDPYDPRALVVEPTFTSSTQIIKLIPMNDPTYMPLYTMPFETESVRANVGHWVWSTGFLEAHAWVPKQGYRPGRMVPLVIHIVNHSDARQVVVETTLCKCLHYGSGLSKARAMGVAGQGYLMDPTLVTSDVASEEMAFAEGEETTAVAVAVETENPRESRRRSRRSSSNRNSRQPQPSTTTATRRSEASMMPSPPASPYGSNFPSTPTSEQGGESPEGSVHGMTASASAASAAAAARMASPNSMASISSQWGSIHSNSSDSNSNSNGVSGGSGGGGGQVAAAIQAYNSMTINSNGGIQYNPDTLSTLVTSPTPSSTIKESSATIQPLPIIQHRREKLTKSKTLISCSQAVDREIQKTIPVVIPATAGYSILNAPLLEVSYEIVIKIRAEKNNTVSSVVPRRRQGGVRLSVPIVVVVPEDGDLEDEEEEILLANAGLSPEMLGLGGGGNMSSLALGGTTFSGDDSFDFGEQGECPPYEVTASSTSRRRGRR
ncbi:hypothetical protein BGX30_015128 [Mortierella sp. GBA39]|nr:hypothetical protein BGX30_015128 [Mortierella sp. GBA39]